MTKRRNRENDGSSGIDSAGKFEGVHVGRDLETNWEVDVAEKLEEYLLKICSGFVCSTDDVNFAEAALLLQGSVQVYSRKVEYLYALVLHALDFLANKSQEHNPGEQLASPNEYPNPISDESNEDYWEACNFPVVARNCLEVSTSGDPERLFVRPPATLVVIEGDCLDTSADGEDLESCVVGTTNLYRNFILLDPNDTVSVDEYLAGADCDYRKDSVLRSMSRKSFVSPPKKSADKDQNRFQTPTKPNPNVEEDWHEFETGGIGQESDDDEDDPWKPLNPHENGTLKIKPFAKVKLFRKNLEKLEKFTLFGVNFPPAKIFGTISPALNVIWEAKFGRSEKSNTLYDKLRETLSRRGVNPSTFADNIEEEDNTDAWESSGFGHVNDDETEQELAKDKATAEKNKKFDKTEHEDRLSQATLEELCRSHLNVLLANIAESQKQVDVTSRIATWKQKIEHDLEEQESHPPFDIHTCSETIMSKLSRDTTGKCLSFGDVVEGQQKHDVARTFSALLQLVNNGEVRLKTDGADEATCYSADKPFMVELQVKEGDRKKRLNGRPTLEGERLVVSLKNGRPLESNKRRRSCRFS